jgi:hypothetical protein
MVMILQDSITGNMLIGKDLELALQRLMDDRVRGSIYGVCEEKGSHDIGRLRAEYWSDPPFVL